MILFKDTLLDPLITDETVTFQDLKIDNATYGLELENYLKEKDIYLQQAC